MEGEVGRFLTAMADERGLARNTIDAYRNDIKQLVEVLCSGPDGAFDSWSDISADRINACIEQLAASEYAPATISRKVSVIRSFVEYLEARGIIESVALHQVRLPKIEKRTPRTLSFEEIERLLAAPSEGVSPKAIRDRALLELMYATGMRATEIVSLDIKAIDLEGGSITCRSRQIALDDNVVGYLRTYVGQARENLVKNPNETGLFLNHRGQKLTRQGLWLIIKAYAEQIQLDEDVTPHTLRHSFAAHRLDSGTDLSELQHLLGHANITTTRVYHHPDDGRQH